MDPERSWTTPSELEEYAYCPRAAFYRRRWPRVEPTPEAAAGSAYHARALARERSTERRVAAYWAGVILGVALLAAGTWAIVRP